jgi:nucleoside-diphosphate-sugar epimerase
VSGNDKPCVLVTGATGFVGRALAPALAAQGWHVRAASRQRPATPEAGVTWVPLPDLARPADWARLLDGVDHVVHLAGIAHAQAPLDEGAYQRVNTEASRELARAASAAGVSRFVFLSSVRAQSGPEAAGILTEASAPVPTDAYGRSKLAAERAIAAEFPGATLLRPVLIMGPGVKGNLALLQRLARTSAPLPFGALHNRRSLLGLTNLVSIVDFCLIAEAARGATYLAADPEPMSVRDLLATMRHALGRQPRLVPVPATLLGAALMAAGRSTFKPSLLGELRVDTSAMTTAGWRPVSTTEAEIICMMMAAQRPANSR